jgi:fructose-1,6-bisphosphatase II
MQNLPSFYSEKLAYGPRVVEAIARGLPAISLDDPLSVTLRRVADALGKRVPELVVCVLNRHRHAEIIREIRSAGAALRMITDGDITAAVAPSLPDSGVDMFCGIGGSPEAILTATALKALQGDMLVRLWPRDDAERSEIEQAEGPDILRKVWRASDLVRGESGIFCATGISDSPLLPGVRLYGKKAETHSLLMRARSRTVRYIRAVHDLEHKTIFLRSSAGEQKL